MILGAVGIYLMVFGLLAAGWAVSASFGQAHYAELILKPHDLDANVTLARQAYRGYSRNYSLCISAARTAFKAAEAATNTEAAASLFSQADYWVSRGLDLNPWLVELHDLKARLLEKQGNPVGALEAWQTYADWHVWEPRNLEILAQFQEKAGRNEDALRTLECLKAHPAYAEWRKRLEGKAQTAMPGAITPAGSAGAPL